MQVQRPHVLASIPAGRGEGLSKGHVVLTGFALVVGIVLGLIVGGEDRPSEPSSPTLEEDGIATGFSHDERGAAEAAASFTDLFDVELALNEDRARAVLDRVATPAFAEQQLASLRELGRPLADSVDEGREPAAVARSVASEVERYSRNAATVRVVSFAAIVPDGMPAKLEVTEQRMDLSWVGGQWRAAAVDGPARPVATSETRVAEARRLRDALTRTTVEP